MELLQRSLPATEVNGCASAVCKTSGKLAVLQQLLRAIVQMPNDPAALGGSHRLVLVSNFTQVRQEAPVLWILIRTSQRVNAGHG